MKRSLVVLVWPLALLATACGVTVEGFVREEGTERPIPGAQVQIGEEATSTDGRGFYQLKAKSKPDQPQSLQVAADGFVPVSRTITILDEPDPLTLSLVLERVAPPEGTDVEAGQPREGARGTEPAGRPREESPSEADEEGP